MLKLNSLFIGLVSSVAITSAANAAVLANWTFETSIPTTAGPHTAEAGVFGATSAATLITGTGNANAVTNPVGNGSAESFSSSGWETNEYYKFTSKTTGYNNITLSWDQTRSSTGPATFDLLYSVNGGSFVTAVNDYAVLENSATGLPTRVAWNSTTRQAQYTFSLPATPALANAASVEFRLVSQVTTASGGTNRVDNFSLDGDLLPTNAAPTFVSAPYSQVVDVSPGGAVNDIFTFSGAVSDANNADTLTVSVLSGLPSFLTFASTPAAGGTNSFSIATNRDLTYADYVAQPIGGYVVNLQVADGQGGTATTPFTLTLIPEPASLAAVAGLALVGIRRRR